MEQESPSVTTTGTKFWVEEGKSGFQSWKLWCLKMSSFEPQHKSETLNKCGLYAKKKKQKKTVNKNCPRGSLDVGL